jgi:hypothetical protein
LEEGKISMTDARNTLATEIIRVAQSSIADGQKTRRVRELLDSHSKPRILEALADDLEARNHSGGHCYCDAIAVVRNEAKA